MVLKNILADSEKYYRDIKVKLQRKLADLPRGSIKERKISGKDYYYLQQRIDKKIIHKYLGKNKPIDLLKQIEMRKVLKKELKKVNEALIILERSKGRKRD